MDCFRSAKASHEHRHGHIRDWLAATSWEDEVAVWALEDRLAEVHWGVYRVRRVYSKPGRAQRKVELVRDGSRGECKEAVRRMAAERGCRFLDDAGTVRFYVRERVPDEYPATEEMYVAAPAVVENKGRGRFEERWAQAIA